MEIEVHLSIDGNCREAFEYYRELFDGHIEGMLSYGESPMAEHVAAEDHHKIVHATITLANLTLAGADILNDFKEPVGFNLLIQLDSKSEAETLANKLAEGGEIIMPLQKTFWSPAYGIVTDKFAVPWEINCAS